ncbi:MAG: metal-dependent phosphohydrolase [Pseudomonadota bacterium]
MGGRARIKGPTILCRGGAYFDLADPEGSDIHVEDIAHALSHLCRFTGHARQFYSVAEHCVHASHLVPPEFALEALMHDAAEAYVGDVAAPLKALLPDYRRIEARVERAIRRRFNLPLGTSAAVKRADLEMLRAEQVLVMSNHDDWGLDHYVFPPLCVECWPPVRARAAFLDRFRELGGVL